MCKQCGCQCAQQCEKSSGGPRLNESAPDFEATTTQGVLRLSDYRDSWLILFSNPSDFTPVCTTEFIAFARIYPELQERGVELLGLCSDSIYAHIAWIRSMEEKFGVKISFPVISDPNKEVAALYGMVTPGGHPTETIRGVFIIDPKGILRAMTYYPRNVGRNTREILRLIDALQTCDKHQVATPANWEPGEKVIIPPPGTQDAAEKRQQEDYEYIDWYLCKKSVE